MLVAAANLAARAVSVRPLMRLSEANALAQPVVFPHEPEEDLDALCQLAEVATRFSPLVGLEQTERQPWAGRTSAWPESLLLDVTGIGSFFGSEQQLVSEIASWLNDQCLFGCLAIADTGAAAWALANYALRQNPISRQVDVTEHSRVAKPINIPESGSTATRRYQETPNSTGRIEPAENGDSGELAEPDTGEEPTHYASLPSTRSLVCPPGEEVAWLGPLPVQALRLDASVTEALNKLAIYTFADLQKFPRAGLASRLGRNLLLRWDQMLGDAREEFIRLTEADQWQVSQPLEHPVSDLETLTEILHRLCRTLAGRLGKRGKGALRCLCRLEMFDAPAMIIQLGLFRPTCDPKHLGELLAGQLSQELSRAAARDVCDVSLSATLIGDLLWRQGELFEAGEVEHRSQIAALVDGLSGRLGRKRVLSVKTTQEAQPELGYELAPMTGRKTDGTEQSAGRKLSSRLSRRRAEPTRDDPLRRPSHLLPTPVQLRLRFTESQAGSQEKPVQFLFAGTWHTILSRVGPERLESGWWRGPSCRRDYYRVITSDGSWWWLFRDMSDNQWYAHGKFD